MIKNKSLKPTSLGRPTLDRVVHSELSQLLKKTRKRKVAVPSSVLSSVSLSSVELVSLAGCSTPRRAALPLKMLPETFQPALNQMPTCKVVSKHDEYPPRYQYFI